MEEADSPLIKALPPESDYYTYLTIVEYNLSQETLPILHRVLQDEDLTRNIGWDLVHLLVPYLPESQQCLHEIARLGNPREVILKVTEGLRLIEYDPTDEVDIAEEATEAGAADVRVRAESSTYPLKTAPLPEDQNRPSISQAVELPPPPPLAVTQFIHLLSMLSVLHARIRTKNPSRFLSTSLQAILSSFSKSSSHREEMIRAIVTTIKAIAGTKRPTLPNRQSSGMLGSSKLYKSDDQPAGDPEATGSTNMTPAERAMESKLLQSFVTHVLEEYLLNLPATKDDVPGMAWCSRIMEALHPERIVPETKTLAHRFASEEPLHRRIDAVGQLVTLAQDLAIKDEDLLIAARMVEKVPESHGEEEDEPPDSAEEVPLSRLGSMLLYTARQVSTLLYDAPRSNSASFAIFPDHHELVKNCLSAPNQGAGSLGTEPDTLIDAVVSIGLLTLEDNSIGEPSSDEHFNEYLQTMALLSSNCPSPNLRGHAHYLTTTILRSHPEDDVRLAFIRDTLEHCPFENLKVSAVGWVKGETIEANPPSAMRTQASNDQASIFAKPLALDTLSPFLFPSLRADLLTSPMHDAWLTFRSNLSFYLASLNFLYLLLCAKHVHEALLIHDLWVNNDIAGSFIQPLRQARERFKKDMHGGGELSEERSDEVLAEMNVLENALERVEGSVRLLNE